MNRLERENRIQQGLGSAGREIVRERKRHRGVHDQVGGKMIPTQPAKLTLWDVIRIPTTKSFSHQASSLSGAAASYVSAHDIALKRPVHGAMTVCK